MRATAGLLGLLMLSVALSGCFGNFDDGEQAANLNVPNEENSATATRGQIYTLTVESNVPYTVYRPHGTFFVDDAGVFRDAMNMTFDKSIETVELLVLDTEQSSFELTVTAGTESWNRTLDIIDSDETMVAGPSIPSIC